ncbi:MAG: aminotransferase class IV [Nitrospinales bacterium]
MTTRINFNGDIRDTLSISVFDHGFLFGDSVYEVICTRNDRPCFMKRHLQRLRKSAAEISLAIPWSDERFEQEIRRTLKAANNTESSIRIVVTRGEGEIDIDPTSCGTPNVLIFVVPARIYPPEDYRSGIHVAVVRIKRNLAEALNPAIKTGNYLNNVLAKIEANKLNAKDALMLNNSGFLTECTTSNFFFVREDRVKTASPDCGILSGITREILMQLARESGILVEEGHWLPEELETAEEAFVSGTLRKVMPVTRLNGKAVGDGKPGPITRRLMRLYESALEKGVN